MLQTVLVCDIMRLLEVYPYHMLLLLLLQVIDETHQAYVRLKSGKRANDEELSLI